MVANISFWTNPEKYVENLYEKSFQEKSPLDCHKGNIEYVGK
jgi:hypothetical protein